MESGTQGVLQVGEWRVSPGDGVIGRAGEQRHLDARTMEVLAYLAAHAGEAVSRRDLERDLWHGAPVSDDALHGTIVTLRAALGDDAHRPTYIETVPQRGFRLLAPVAAVEPPIPPGTAAMAERRSRDRARVALMFLVLAAVAAVIWALLTRLVPPPAAPGRPGTGSTAPPLSIPVHPIANPGAAPVQWRLADPERAGWPG